MALRRLLDKERRRHGFISIAALTRLVTEAAIRDHLRFRAVTLEPSVPSYIVSNAQKLFAILVLLELEYCMDDFANCGASDDMFPIREVDIPFLDLESRCDFYRTQWDIPPKLDRARHLEFPGDTILPFTRKEYSDHGSFGIIHEVTVAEGHLDNISPDRVLALKIVRKQERDSWETIMREVDTLRQRQHPNIVPLLASYTIGGTESNPSSRHLNMLFPYAQMNMEEWLNLRQAPLWLLKRNFNNLAEYLYYSIYGLISGLAFLHREIRGLATSHHDLKPKNILVIDGDLLIADLGRSHLISLEHGSETEGTSGLGTFRYHPPEYWNADGKRAARRHGRAFDVWAMGCLIIEVAILIVYGWEREMVYKFRQECLMLRDDQRRFDHQPSHESGDDSFHNSMDVVYQWLLQLQRDGNFMMTQTIDIVRNMLQPVPEDRLYSWEAGMDLYDVLNPTVVSAERLTAYAAWVQGPSKTVQGHSTPLHRASSRGHHDRVVALLQAGWPPDLEDGNGVSAAQLAERNGHHAVRSVLLQQLANTESRPGRLAQTYRPAVDFPSTNHQDGRNGTRSQPDLLSQPVARDSTPRQTYSSPQPAPYDTYGTSHLHSGQHLMPQGLNYGEQPTDQVLPRSLPNGHARTEYGAALLDAARQGDLDSVQLLLERGADPTPTDEDGNTALHVAVDQGRADLVLLLAARGADINARNNDGDTALHIAAHRDFSIIIMDLLRWGADTAARDQHGNTALHVAASRGNYSVASGILFWGADVDARSGEDGKTALHLAAYYGRYSVVSTLLYYKANFNITDDEGHTALHHALRRGHGGSAELLIKYGADINAAQAYQ